MSRDSGGSRRKPYWPDRDAHRRRLSARRFSRVALVLVLVLPWFGYRHVRDWLAPTREDVQAAEEIDAALAPAATAVPVQGSGPSLVAAVPRSPGKAGRTATQASGGLDAIARDADAGDGERAVARLDALGAELHRQALLADRGNAVRREAARVELAGLPGVRGAGWVDRMTMLVLVPAGGGAHGMVAEACRRLAGHGDATGLAVRVQEVAASGVAGATLQGECRQGRPGVHLLPGVRVPLPGTGPSAGAGQGRSAEEDPEAAAQRRQRQEESLRILSETTPELRLADPRVDPDAH